MNLAQIVQSSQTFSLSLQDIINSVEKGLMLIGMIRKNYSNYKFSEEVDYTSSNGKKASAIFLKDCVIATDRGEPMLALVYFDNIQESEFSAACDAFLVHGTYVYMHSDIKRVILDSLRRKMGDMATKKK